MSGRNIRITSSRQGKFELVKLSLVLPELRPALTGYRIVQLTDTHYGPCTSSRHIQAAVQIAKRLAPDLAVLTGDYLQPTAFSLKHAAASRLGPKLTGLASYRRSVRADARNLGLLLGELDPPDGIVGVFGNHDYLEGLSTIMRQFGERIRWLKNASFAIQRGGETLLIAGVDDFKRGKPNLATAVQGTAIEAAGSSGRYALRLLLSHNPDIVTLAHADLLETFDLLLCGHTHGGQICLPLLGPIITRTRQKDHVAGLSRCGNLAVYVSRGIGYGLIPLRLYCAPEITLIELCRE